MISTKQVTFELKTKKKKALKIKLYHTIEEACLQIGEFEWHDLASVIGFNSPNNRTEGIICYTYKREDGVVSIKTASKTYRYANCKNIEVKVV